MRWMPVTMVGVDGYEVSDAGDVRLGEKTLSSRLLKGYPGVSLAGAPRSRRTFTVHSLVMAAFVGPRPSPSHQVNHKNGIKTDNRLCNLEYVTSAENIAHSWNELGNSRYGADNPACKLNWDLVRMIRSEYIPNICGAHRLAKKYGVTNPLIFSIVKNRIWREEL